MVTTLTSSVGLKPHDVDAEQGMLASIGKNIIFAWIVDF